MLEVRGLQGYVDLGITLSNICKDLHELRVGDVQLSRLCRGVCSIDVRVDVPDTLHIRRPHLFARAQDPVKGASLNTQYSTVHSVLPPCKELADNMTSATQQSRVGCQSGGKAVPCPLTRLCQYPRPCEGLSHKVAKPDENAWASDAEWRGPRTQCPSLSTVCANSPLENPLQYIQDTSILRHQYFAPEKRRDSAHVKQHNTSRSLGR